MRSGYRWEKRTTSENSVNRFCVLSVLKRQARLCFKRVKRVSSLDARASLVASLKRERLTTRLTRLTRLNHRDVCVCVCVCVCPCLVCVCIYNYIYISICITERSGVSSSFIYICMNIHLCTGVLSVDG